MSDTGQSSNETKRPSRSSDPITERTGVVGRGAVLYDTRDPHARPCCARPGGRCLAHVLGVFEETTTGAVYFKVADGTWTTEEWVHADDLLAIFEPAGWSVTGVKPTYLLTREHGVADHHDLMTDGGPCADGTERPGDLERFAIECALDAAWATEFWVPADPEYGFVDYVEAAVAGNLGLLRGFEDLAEDVSRRGILSQTDSDQARLVTDGGGESA